MGGLNNLIDDFFKAYFKPGMKVSFNDAIPKEMIASVIDIDKMVEWRPIHGTLKPDQYVMLEQQYHVEFPMSFIEWHRKYYFFDGDCGVVRLPWSIPTHPLLEITDYLESFENLIADKLYPFGYECNDSGPLVFDGRSGGDSRNFPIRYYSLDYGGDPEGISEVIFSSFEKLLECTTVYLKEEHKRNRSEIIHEFLKIDPQGAGKHGVDYWLGIAELFK